MAQPRLPAPGEPPVRPVPLGQAATYADVAALPPHLRGEIVGGQLYALPRPVSRHNHAMHLVGFQLTGPFGLGRGGPGGWWILPEEEVHLRGDVLVPDVSGWRKERLSALPEGTDRISVPPDWVCQVLSPSTEAYDRGPKMLTYGRHGVPWAWLVDPSLRTLEAYRNDGGSWRPLGTFREADRVRVAPFDAIELELSLLWG